MIEKESVTKGPITHQEEKRKTIDVFKKGKVITYRVNHTTKTFTKIETPLCLPYPLCS